MHLIWTIIIKVLIMFDFKYTVIEYFEDILEKIEL